MDDVLVSVRLMTYNQVAYIEQAIEGVLMQQIDFTWNFVIADDCSTDGTREIVRAYAEKYPNLITVILQEKNVGAAQNCTDLLTYAPNTCKYIAYLEGDDYWTDNTKLQQQISFLEMHPDFNICFHKVMINKDGKLIEDYITNPPKEVTTQKDLLVTNYIHTPSVVFRKVFQTLPDWYLTAFPGDYPLWLILSDNNAKIKYINTAMAVYRVHQQGAWSMQSQQKNEQRIAVTMLNCLKHLSVKYDRGIHHKVVMLADSVYRFGYTNISRQEYYSYIRWGLKSATFTFREKLFFYTANLRRLLKNMSGKQVSGQS